MAKSEVNLAPVDRWLVTTATTIQSVVRAEDYDALLAEIARLKDENSRLWDNVQNLPSKDEIEANQRADAAEARVQVLEGALKRIYAEVGTSTLASKIAQAALGSTQEAVTAPKDEPGKWLTEKAWRYLNDAAADRYRVGYADGILEAVEAFERAALAPSTDPTLDALLTELGQHIEDWDTGGIAFTVADTLSLLKRVRADRARLLAEIARLEGERNSARMLVDDILTERAEDNTREAIDACPECTELVMCDFHSVMSALAKRTWTLGAVERELDRRIATEQRERADAAEARVQALAAENAALREAHLYLLTGWREEAACLRRDGRVIRAEATEKCADQLRAALAPSQGAGE